MTVLERQAFRPHLNLGETLFPGNIEDGLA